MDTSELIVEYRVGDFAQSIRQLLPKGKYWQESENRELANLIDGVATDFKQTHDDIELSLLNPPNETLFGWKIIDYQNLLNNVAGKGSGFVFDEVQQPNLIYVIIEDGFRGLCIQAWQAFEKERLPHTEIAWIYHSNLDVHHQMANFRHIRNLHQYEVTQ